MKCLYTTARNIRHSVHDGVVYPEIEAVLTIGEKQPENVGGSIMMCEKFETVRFGVTPDSARAVAKSLVEWAEEAEKQKKFLEVSADMVRMHEGDGDGEDDDETLRDKEPVD